MKSLPRAFLMAFPMCLAVGAANAQIQFLLLEKQVNYTQTNELTPGVSSGTPYVFRFSADGNGGSSTSSYTPMSITAKPGGTGSLISMTNGSDYNATENTWEYSISYATKTGGAGLDDAYNNGTYSLNINGNAGNITLGSGGGFADLYPEVAPMVTGLSSGDFNGSNQLMISTSLTSYTFNFNSSSFTSYTSGGHIGAFLEGLGSSVKAESFYFGSSTDTAVTQLTFNPSTSGMTAGNTYTLDLEFNLLTDGATDRFLDGETSTGLFTYRTTLSIVAIPEPSTYATILGAAALAGVTLHRRRRLA